MYRLYSLTTIVHRNPSLYSLPMAILLRVEAHFYNSTLVTHLPRPVEITASLL